MDSESTILPLDDPAIAWFIIGILGILSTILHYEPLCLFKEFARIQNLNQDRIMALAEIFDITNCDVKRTIGRTAWPWWSTDATLCLYRTRRGDALHGSQ